MQKILARDLELFFQTTKVAMKTLSPIPVTGLFLLLALMFAEAGSLEAKDKANDQQYNKVAVIKNDPPDRAPAHGYRRKFEDDDKCHKNKKHKDKHKDKSYNTKEEELERREAELSRREAALRRKERNRDRGTLSKKRPTEEAKKRRASEPTSNKNERIYKSPRTKAEEILDRKKQEERRQQEEVKRKIPGKQEEDWTGGSGW